MSHKVIQAARLFPLWKVTNSVSLVTPIPATPVPFPSGRQGFQYPIHGSFFTVTEFSENTVYVIWILFEASFMCFLRMKSETDTIRFVKIIFYFIVCRHMCAWGAHVCEQVYTHMNGGQRTISGATPPLRQAWLSPIRLDCLAMESRQCCQHWDCNTTILWGLNLVLVPANHILFQLSHPPESYVQISCILHFYLINLTVVEKG